MPGIFKRFVEVGRMALINQGDSRGSLCTIVDIVDQNRCIIDGPLTGVERQIINYKRLNLTDLVVKISRGAKSKTLKKELESQGTIEAWKKSSWAKKIEARTIRSNLSDFDRFKALLARKSRSVAINTELKKLRKQKN